MTDLLLLSRIPGISRGFSGRGGLSSAVFGAFFFALWIDTTLAWRRRKTPSTVSRFYS